MATVSPFDRVETSVKGPGMECAVAKVRRGRCAGFSFASYGLLRKLTGLRTAVLRTRLRTVRDTIVVVVVVVVDEPASFSLLNQRREFTVTPPSDVAEGSHDAPSVTWRDGPVRMRPSRVALPPISRVSMSARLHMVSGT